MRLIQLEQGSDAWLNMRNEKITATDASVITGKNPFTSPYTLWKRKLGLEPPVQLNAAMKRGMALEDEAREKFEEYTNIKMTPAVVESDQTSWMMASLDGLSDNGEFQLEIKCPNNKTHEMAKAGELPAYYHAQIQHQLAVTGNDWSYYFTYDGSDGALVEVERDDAFICEMMEMEEDFYRRMREFDAPDQSHLVLENETMKALVSEYMEANAMKKQADKLEKELRKKLIDASEGNSIQSFGLKLTHYYQKGRVRYDAIPELQGIDLDQYRGPVEMRARVSFT